MLLLPSSPPPPPPPPLFSTTTTFSFHPPFFFECLLCQLFYKKDLTAQEVTVASGIASIFPNATVHEYLFEPCGYSCNALFGEHYFTIHITPQKEFSYVWHRLLPRPRPASPRFPLSRLPFPTLPVISLARPLSYPFSTGGEGSMLLGKG